MAIVSPKEFIDALAVCDRDTGDKYSIKLSTLGGGKCRVIQLKSLTGAETEKKILQFLAEECREEGCCSAQTL